MTDFQITILGSNSAIFNHGRHPSAQFVQIQNQHFLIDCGEGTQERMHENKVKWFKIDYIFISHLHGDHYFGLIGLLTTFNLLKRKNKLTIFAPKELKKIIQQQLKVSNTTLNFDLKFVATQTDDKYCILDIPECTVYSFPLNHRIPTTGFLITSKTIQRKLDLEKIQQFQIDKTQYKFLIDGEDVLDVNGKKIKNSWVTQKGKPTRSYAYCSDTVYDVQIVQYIKNANLLYHEATFLHQDKVRAKETMHTTALQAAQIAKKAKVQKLILGHFSSRYYHLSELEEEAKTVFENTALAIEGNIFSV
ncbi:MAG: ribonuclease Z [Chitinophagales bacterium]